MDPYLSNILNRLHNSTVAQFYDGTFKSIYKTTEWYLINQNTCQFIDKLIDDYKLVM